MKKISKLVALTLLALSIAMALCSCAKKDVKLLILDTEYAIEDYAICIAKDNDDLLGKVDAALVELIADGSVKKVVDKYISGVEHDLVFGENSDGLEELIMATNAEFPPYEYHDDGKIVGIDAEIAALIADKLGMKLRIDDMDFNAIIPAVQTGKAHMGMAGMTVSETRLQSVNFTTSYATGIQVVVVREGSDITSVDDLFDVGGFAIGVQTATTGDIYATDDFEAAGLCTVQRYNKGADAIGALVSGKIDCVIIDNEPAKAFVAANNGK